jgi:D-xylose transport system permease protein
MRDPVIAKSLGSLSRLFQTLAWRQSFSTTLGIALIWLIFYSANERFISSVNLTNLILQIAAVGTISIGANLLLLIGEIDLSIGMVSGLSAAVMAVLNVRYAVPAVLSIAAGVAVGALTGLVTSAVVTVFRIPSFIVSLGGLLAWQGALLKVLGSSGTINLRDPVITALAGNFIPNWAGLAIGVAAIGGYGAMLLSEERERRRAGLQPATWMSIGVRLGVPAALVVASLLVFGADRGAPVAFLIFIGTVVAVETLCRRTRFGRFVFAVGGNAEAAHRAGIPVQQTRVLVFVMASTLAAAGGILAASRLRAVTQASGGGDLLLQAIAAAVIGGTSLFGGRGTMWAALLGSLLIGSISNGMDLLAFDSAIKYMVTGAVLVLAVVVDSTARGAWRER